MSYTHGLRHLTGCLPASYCSMSKSVGSVVGPEGADTSATMHALVQQRWSAPTSVASAGTLFRIRQTCRRSKLTLNLYYKSVSNPVLHNCKHFAIVTSSIEATFNQTPGKPPVTNIATASSSPDARAWRTAASRNSLMHGRHRP